MNNLQNESEAIQLSIYCDIICQILFHHRNISVNKILPIVYLLKDYEHFKKTYNGKNLNDLTYKMLSLLSGKYSDYCSNIPIIIKAIHLLILNGNIREEDGFIFFIERKDNAKKFLYDINSFFYNAIEDCKKMPEVQFLKEVIQNV